MSRLTPNPLYLFSRLEARMLVDRYVTPALREEFSLAVGQVNFNPKLGKVDAHDVLKWSADSAGQQRIILTATFQTTLKVPHLIHEDGSMEETPDRQGPMRTYFDGYIAQDLGHAVAICIDKQAQTITTQCPKGRDFPLFAETMLRRHYPDFDRVTIRAEQQKDQHSCMPWTIYNVLSFAGVKEPKEEIDMQLWRGELLSTLDSIEATADPESWQGAAVRDMRNERLDEKKPYACKRQYLERSYRYPPKDRPVSWWEKLIY